MKRKMTKLLIAVMTLVLAISMTVGAHAFTGDYFETTECWDYVEEETVIGNSVEAVVGTSKTIYDDAAGTNNYNVYALEMDIDGYTAQQLFDASGSAFESEFKTAIQSQYNAMGWSAEFVSFNTSLAYDHRELYQFILMEAEQNITDDAGNTTTVYQNMAIFPADTYVVYVTVTNYNSAEECEEVFYEIVDYIEIYDYTFSDESGIYTSEELTRMGKGILIGVLVFFLVILIVIIVVIVIVVKSSKKKKAQRAAQQYNPYGGNPNGQYNPYGQPPVNNGQYNPYGQQNNTYTPYTPSQPPVNEQKDPLDLDNQ